MYLYPVELHHRAVLSVPHHRGLNHLPERCFLLQQINKILSVQTNSLSLFDVNTSSMCVFYVCISRNSSYLTFPWEMRMPLSVSKPTEGPWPV